MAYSNGFQTVVQSMNGTLSFNDGSGTIIENGTINAQSIAINNIPAVLPTPSVSLWNNLVTGNALIMTSITSGTIYIGNSAISIASGAFTFFSNSIQTSLTSTINLFTTYTGTTANLFTGMTTGGTLNIGSSTNTNKIGSLFINDNQISANGITILRDTQRLGYETVSRTNPASYTVNSTFVSASEMNVTTDYICGGTTLRNYDVRQIVETNGAQAGDGRGTLKTICLNTNIEFPSFSENIPPAHDPSSYELRSGYYGFQDDASYIAGSAPYGGISFGGCGYANPVYNTTYQRAMTIYPLYGLRLYTGGISFDKGNLTTAYGGGRGFFIQTGLFTASTATTIASQGTQSYFITFTTSFFGVNPIVTCNLRNVSISTSFVLGINVITSGFSITLRNVSNVSVTGTIGIYYTAIGPY